MESNAYHNSSNPKHDEVMAEVDKYFKENFNNKTDRTVFRWIAKHDSNTCKTCQEMDGVEHENIEDFPFIPPIHPNCKCEIIEVSAPVQENKVVNKLQQKEVETKVKNQNNKKEERYKVFIDKLMSPDYENTGYIDNPNKIDQPTNTGITQKALDSYISRHKDKNISHDLKKLDAQTIREMYREDYYDSKKIDEIQNDRIAYAVFDMGVMTSPGNVGRVIQNSLNEYGIKLEIDGIIGKDTISKLNSVDDVPKFMEILKKNRKEFLNKQPEKYKYPGWFNRTDRY